MRFPLLVLGFLSLSAAGIRPQGEFTAYDIFIDIGDHALAAYQFEISCDAKIVGVEGNAGLSFNSPPYYDPQALQGGRIIIAALTTKDAPKGRNRVATVHFFEEKEGETTSKLLVSVRPDGETIEAKIEIIQRGGK